MSDEEWIAKVEVLIADRLDTHLLRTGVLVPTERRDPGHGSRTPKRNAPKRKRVTHYREIMTFDVRPPGQLAPRASTPSSFSALKTPSSRDASAPSSAAAPSLVPTPSPAPRPRNAQPTSTGTASVHAGRHLCAAHRLPDEGPGNARDQIAKGRAGLRIAVNGNYPPSHFGECRR